MTTVFLLLCLLCFSADGNIASYVKQICERKPIHTTADKTVGDNGFRIIFEGLPGPDTYRPGETYT
ncbi:spondin-1, partial [Biomphalaria glabrata]